MYVSELTITNEVEMFVPALIDNHVKRISVLKEDRSAINSLS